MSVLERLNEALKATFYKINIYKKADMATYLGYKNPYFSGIINGKEDLSDKFLNLISDKLNININWILTGEGEMLNRDLYSGKNIEDTASELSRIQMENELLREILSERDNKIDNLNQYIGRLEAILSQNGISADAKKQRNRKDVG